MIISKIFKFSKSGDKIYNVDNFKKYLEIAHDRGYSFENEFLAPLRWFKAHEYPIIIYVEDNNNLLWEKCYEYEN